MKKILLTKEESVMEKEIENGEWVSVPHLSEEIKKYQLQARDFLNKKRKINIRISDWDYNNIKLRAVQEGLPYQTLVSSLIHKYLTGHLSCSRK